MTTIDPDNPAAPTHSAGDDPAGVAADAVQPSAPPTSSPEGDPVDAPARRIVIVGEGLATDLGPRLALQAGGAPVAAVPSFLMAMGAAAAPHEPAIDVLITRARDIADMAAAAAQCIRELLPDTRLIVLADQATADAADVAVRCGFDVRLDEPVSDDALAHALRPAPARARGAASDSHATTRLESGWDEPAVLPWATIHGAPTPAADTDHAVAPSPQPPSPPPAADEPGAAAAHEDLPPELARRDAHASESEPLGDVDLIEAILAPRATTAVAAPDPAARVDALALELITQRSGITGLGWTRLRDHAPPGHTQAPVAYRGRTFGILHAPPATSAQALAAWAAWLGRWLALHDHIHQLATLSMTDELTGAWNRRYFNRFLEHIIEQARSHRSQVTLLVFDIDDFKLYNDRYGHGAGDEILRETARLMQSSVREHDVVARVGGDEFAVIFWDAEQKRRPDSTHPDDVRIAAERFQKAINAHQFPKLLNEAPGTLTISGGLASYPWDGRTPDELLERADEMALQSKRQGKNAITFGPGAERACNAQTDDTEHNPTE